VPRSPGYAPGRRPSLTPGDRRSCVSQSGPRLQGWLLLPGNHNPSPCPRSTSRSRGAVRFGDLPRCPRFIPGHAVSRQLVAAFAKFGARRPGVYETAGTAGTFAGGPGPSIVPRQGCRGRSARRPVATAPLAAMYGPVRKRSPSPETSKKNKKALVDGLVRGCTTTYLRSGTRCRPRQRPEGDPVPIFRPATPGRGALTRRPGPQAHLRETGFLQTTHGRGPFAPGPESRALRRGALAVRPTSSSTKLPDPVGRPTNGSSCWEQTGGASIYAAATYWPRCASHGKRGEHPVGRRAGPAEPRAFDQ